MEGANIAPEIALIKLTPRKEKKAGTIREIATITPTMRPFLMSAKGFPSLRKPKER